MTTLGLSKLRRASRDAEKGRCPLRNKDEGVVLSCKETQMWQDKLLDYKSLHRNEEIAYNEINSRNKTRLKKIRHFSS